MADSTNSRQKTLDMLARCAGNFEWESVPDNYFSPELPDTEYIAPEPMGMSAEEMNQTFREITLEEVYWGRLP